MLHVNHVVKEPVTDQYHVNQTTVFEFRGILSNDPF